jgi:membrane protease YdiL (CAAX protease family)
MIALPVTPLDHRGTSGFPVLDATGERGVHRSAYSIDRSERLVSTSDLGRVGGPSVGSSDSQGLDALPKWVLLVAIIRAGFMEELFYRGYAIKRLQLLTGSVILAAGIPLFIFAVSHYRQGWAGIIVSLLTGAVLTAVYIYKRNLWITITVHYVVDFMLLFAAKH